MGISQIGGAATSRIVTKQNAVGETCLTGLFPIAVNTAGGGQAYGAWVQMTASASSELYVVAVVGRCETGNFNTISAPLTIDIGIGGAGSETVIASAFIESSEMVYGGTSPNAFAGGGYRFSPALRVAAGTRIAARTALQAVGTGRVIDVYLMTAPYANLEGN